uniref:Saposin B-type domain-containing protein n=1 Tax=Strongyloides venezuelensis TaxID=75913 RepID=A0A0K0EUL3_STRVS
MKILTVTFYFVVLVGVTFSIPPMTNDISFDLCSSCKSFFDKVKENMVVVSESTEERLKETLEKTCDKMLNKIPFLNEECKRFLEEVSKGVVKDLNEAQELVNPDNICQTMHMCRT